MTVRLRRLLAALALAVTTVTAAACQPQSGTVYFGTCPAGDQYPVQTSPGVWKCEGQ
jgi:hypothetical protein